MHQYVYVVDDDAAVRESMSFFIGSAGLIARPFGDPHEFIAASEGLSPGCVLLDYRMPGLDGFEVLAQLEPRRAELPVIMMTGHGDIVTAVRAMKLGARDFLEKPFEEDVLLEILERTFDFLEGSVREAGMKRDACGKLSHLTEREREVLHGLLAGQPNKVLAYELGISIRTVEMHRAAMMDRLGVRTLAEAMRLAFDGGLAVPTDKRRSGRKAEPA